MSIRSELVGANQVNLVQAPIPDPPLNGLIVKVHYAGVCRTDVRFFEDRITVDDIDIKISAVNPNFRHPMVCGHEIAGEVHSIGAELMRDVPAFQVGDHVVVYPWRGCSQAEECEGCQSGMINYCEFSAERAYGIGRDGGFQSYVTVSDRRDVQKVPDSLPLDVACMLGCSALTAYNAVSKAKPAVEEGIAMRGKARLLIIGAGGLGLWAVQWAKQLLPPGTEVGVADVSEEKLSDGKSRGADIGVLWAHGTEVDDMAAKVKEAFGGAVDAAIDFVGALVTVQATQKAIRRGAHHILVGLVGPTIPIPLLPFIIRTSVMMGVYVGSPLQLSDLVKLVAAGKVEAPPITVYQPEELLQVIEKFNDGTMRGRAVIKYLNHKV